MVLLIFWRLFVGGPAESSLRRWAFGGYSAPIAGTPLSLAFQLTDDRRRWPSDCPENPWRVRHARKRPFLEHLG